jgi:hypothetical protein
MRLKLTCVRAALESYGPVPVLSVELSGGPFTRSGTLKLTLAHPTLAQRSSFVIGELYEIDIPRMAEHPWRQEKDVGVCSCPPYTGSGMDPPLCTRCREIAQYGDKV